MEWGEAISGLRVVESSGRRDVVVRGVQYDSRRVCAGDVFVAMRGGTSDGNRYIDAAIRQGAAAVVTDSAEMFAELREKQPELTVALVERGRRALAEISSAVFGAPEKTLKLSAVTGTNGKTTTAFLLEQMLRSVGRQCVLLGTIETHVGDEVRQSEHTTPESRDVLAVFADGVRVGCTEAVMEMSSHALEQERVWGMPVDVAIFTNLTQDHLDYHGTMQKYAEAKARLFAGVGAEAPRVAVINLDDDFSCNMEQAAKASGCKVWTYGISGPYMPESGTWDVPIHRGVADFLARNLTLSASAISFDLITPFGETEIDAKLAGTVNVYNLMAASCAALARGLTLEQISNAAKSLRQVPGRFETVENDLGITVVVDYAHTDDALKNLIGLARDLVGTGRVITMFGCGGDRDRTKRPKMGRLAASMSDMVVVTSDNPRSEEPMEIIAEVMVGMRDELGMYAGEFIVEEDRRAAIEVAIRAAKVGDIVLLAGKGHEKVQIFADGAVPFDDVAEAERVLRMIAAEA